MSMAYPLKFWRGFHSFLKRKGIGGGERGDSKQKLIKVWFILKYIEYLTN
jgi:hypothetical protein